MDDLNQLLTDLNQLPLEAMPKQEKKKEKGKPHKVLVFYLEKTVSLHLSIFNEENMQRNFVIEVPHWLLVIFHSHLQ